jgi:hypothetical protein
MSHIFLCVRGGGGRERERSVDMDVRALACVYACVALLIQHATRRHNGICGLSGSTIFFDSIS